MARTIRTRRSADGGSARPPSLRGGLLAAAVLVSGLGLLGCVATQPRSTLERLSAAEASLDRVLISATVADRTLAATEAVADFGIDEGVRMVRVRIVDELDLEIHVQSPEALTLAEPPTVCLVGPYSAPDDAGLSDRCWGEPDLGALLAARLAADDAGHPTLRANEPVVLSATIRRGDVRCDYPPGTWQLEITWQPLVDGQPVGRVEQPAIPIVVSPQATQPLPLRLFDTRYCGLATAVYLDQGEPPVQAP